MDNSSMILKDISYLILLVENSNLGKIDKLEIIKVLFNIKLKVIELLKKELRREVRVKPENSLIKNHHDSFKTSDKLDLILHFIKDNKGRVGATELLKLGIAGRSLRRYIRNLVAERKIKIEKSGRNYFYLLV